VNHSVMNYAGQDCCWRLTVRPAWISVRSHSASGYRGRGPTVLLGLRSRPSSCPLSRRRRKLGPESDPYGCQTSRGSNHAPPRKTWFSCATNTSGVRPSSCHYCYYFACVDASLCPWFSSLKGCPLVSFSCLRGPSSRSWDAGSALGAEEECRD